MKCVPPQYRPLRFAQAEHILALQGGQDGLMVAATGSGKSLTICLSACAEYVTRAEANLEAIRRCEPVDLVLSPLNASASSLVTFANRYFGDVASDLEVFGDRPIALHVDRSGFGEGHVNDGARQRRTGHTPMCPQGHRLDYQTVRPKTAQLRAAHCDVCRKDIDVNTSRWSCIMCDYVCGKHLPFQ